MGEMVRARDKVVAVLVAGKGAMDSIQTEVLIQWSRTG